MMVKLNRLTTADKIALYKEKFGNTPIPVREFIAKFAKGPQQARFASSLPPGFLAALTGVLVENMERKKPLSITWAWKPAYDYELTIWECEDTAISAGGITILLGTRYPLDPHPVDIGKTPRGGKGGKVLEGGKRGKGRGRRGAKGKRAS
jgi:hypothetical protein